MHRSRGGGGKGEFTFPLFWSTYERLTRETNFTVGALSGYCSPHVMTSDRIRPSSGDCTPAQTHTESMHALHSRQEGCMRNPDTVARQGWIPHGVNSMRSHECSKRLEQRTRQGRGAGTDPMRPHNHAIPDGEGHVVAIGKPVADHAIANPLLAPFQLVQQHEVARDCQQEW